MSQKRQAPTTHAAWLCRLIVGVNTLSCLSFSECPQRDIKVLIHRGSTGNMRSNSALSSAFINIQTTKDCYKYSFFPHTIADWNQLSPRTREATSVDAFKALLCVPSAHRLDQLPAHSLLKPCTSYPLWSLCALIIRIRRLIRNIKLISNIKVVRIIKIVRNIKFVRRQCVVINGTCSEWKRVLSGIPQGGVLGPIFICHIHKRHY